MCVCVYIYVCVSVYIYIYIYIGIIQWLMFVQQHCFQQSFYQMMTLRFRLGFGSKASLLLNQSGPIVTHDTIRLYWMVVTLWDCHNPVVRALSWIFSLYFLLCDGESPRLVQNAEVELVMKPQHLTSIGNTLVIQPFLTHCSRRCSYFSNMRPVEIIFKRNH